MSSYQQVTILGNVGRDPETKYTSNGNAITNLSLATTRKWKSQDGEKHEETEWHRITFFGRSAEIIGEYVQKGNPLFVTGYLKTRKWQDKDGNDRYTTEIIAENFQLMARNEQRSGASDTEQDQFNNRGRSAPQKPAAKPAARAPQSDLDDDIPF